MYTQILISNQLDVISQSLERFCPEIYLAGLFIVLVLADLILKNRSALILPWLTLAGLVPALVLELNQFCDLSSGNVQNLFSGFLQLDQLSVFFKIFFTLASIITSWFVIISSFRRNLMQNIRGEFYSIFIALLLGVNLMAMASNFLMVYISIELVSIASYIITTYSFDKKSSEAGMKYLLFGAFASGLMLYGMSLLYGFSGSLAFNSPEFIQSISSGQHHWMVLLACFLVLAGLFFKIAAIPFHVWAPDVYESAPVPAAAFFSVAPKAAGIALLIHFVYPFVSFSFSGLAEMGYFLGFIAIATITIGNLAALGQNNIRRILAYSSIAHAGFVLIGLIAFSKFAVLSILFYFSVYLVMNFAAFGLVDFIASKAGSEDVRNFKGLGGKLPLTAFIFVLVMVALTGLPPTAGFNAKLLVFSAVWEAYQVNREPYLLWAFIAALLNTVIALFYYLKVPYYMYFKKAESESSIKLNTSENVFLCLMSIPLLVLFFKPDWLLDQLQKIVFNF